MENHCIACQRTLTTYADDCHTVVVEQGETECCCGSIDETSGQTIYFDAMCTDCCAPYHVGQIHEGMNAGGGYFIVNPSF